MSVDLRGLMVLGEPLRVRGFGADARREKLVPVAPPLDSTSLTAMRSEASL
jgi:hypothetical protein